jgi:formate dehydrogenase major subunit
MEKLSRRNFLKLSAAGAGGGSLLLAANLGPAEATTHVDLHKKIGEAYTICPYCSCGCGLIIATNEEGHATNVEGDPDNPVNRARLCPKAAALGQLLNNPRRLTNVMYRAPGTSEWEVKTWDWAMAEIGQRIKKTRDATWVPTVKVSNKDVTVNRTEGIAWMGGAANSSEDCYLSSKLARGLGVVYLEHQARI